MHNLVTGDVAKFQELLKDKGLYGKVVNDKPVLKTISVNNIQEIEAQRDTAVKWGYDSIVARGGLDNSVFEPINVIEQNGVFYCYDGLGRLCIHQIMGIKTIEAWVSQGTQEEAASRFSWLNKKGIRSVCPESIFSADVYAKCLDALEELDGLEDVGLSVRVRSDKILPETSQDPQIKIAGFRKAMKFAKGDTQIVKMARDIIVNAYPQDLVIRADLLVGLVIVLETYDTLRRPGVAFAQLENYFKTVALTSEQKDLPFKKDGGNQHNAESESVAYGIVKNFSKSKLSTEHVTQQLRHKVLLNKFNLTEQRQ